jgi:PleD family two-component response regulator
VLDRLKGTKIELGDRTISITFESGWTNYIPGELPQDLLKRADAALYVNKRAGKEQRDLEVAAT